MLVFDVHIVSLRGFKTPPLEQKKKKGFCKFHSFLGHKTSQCVFFRGSVQNTLKEGMLKFYENLNPKKEVDLEPKAEEALFIEHVEVLMVDVIEGLDTKTDEVNMFDYN